MRMLFRKKHHRICEHCIHSTKFTNEQVLCKKRGVRAADSACRKFTYDPCKRIPVKAKGPDFDKYNEIDFSL